MLLAVASCVLLLIALKGRVKILLFCAALFFVVSKYCIHMENNDQQGCRAWEKMWIQGRDGLPVTLHSVFVDQSRLSFH